VKALLITNDFRPMAGGEARVYERICATVRPDRVVVLAPRMPGDRAFDRRQPYRVVRRWTPTNPHPLARLTQVFFLFMSAARVIRREQIGVVHIGHLYLGVIGLALRRLFKIPYVIYLHGGEMAAYMRVRGIEAIARAVVRNASTVVVNSTFTRTLYAAKNMANSHTELLAMGADTTQFHPGLDGRRIRARYGLDGTKVLLTVGRLVERKGHEAVLRALGRVRQAVGPVRYLIAGRGPEEERLRALARALGIADQVLFVGHVPDDELPYLYAACDVFVMPSRALAQRDGVEGFGIVFLEAGACGKPVIGGRSGGIADAVIDGVTGLLINPTDADDLADALIRLLGNPAQAARLGAQGRQRAVELESAWRAALQCLWNEPDTRA